MANVSVFIGGIRPLPESGRPTGIYKSQVTGVVEIGLDGFVGDQQADLRVHGGPEKAVHLYPARHYEQLAIRFPDAGEMLKPGSMGENLSTPDIDERDVRVGDVWKLGTARLQVCQPRTPCWKIDERFGCDGMTAFVADQLLTGWYWRVVETGRVSPGDTLDLVEPAADAPTLRDAMLLWREHRPPIAELEKLAQRPGIGKRWRDKIEQRLDWLKREAR